MILDYQIGTYDAARVLYSGLFGLTLGDYTNLVNLVLLPDLIQTSTSATSLPYSTRPPLPKETVASAIPNTTKRKS